MSIFPRLNRILSAPDIAIDLGTANTRLYTPGRGLIADEPSMVKVRPGGGAFEAVGSRAVLQPFAGLKSELVSPLREGVVADVAAATALLGPLFKRARWAGFLRPRVLACAPTDACEEEREALIEAARRAGAAAVALVPEPLAAAIGAGLDVSSEYAQMVVDIGDGVTDIAVIRGGSLISTAAVRIACSNLVAAVCRSVAERHHVDPCRREAERLTWKVGANHAKLPLSPYVIAGVDCQTGLLRRVYVHGHEVATAMKPVLNTITGAVSEAMKNLPPEIGCEVIESGIHLTGGGACLPGMADLIAAETNLDVQTAKNPMRAVINGARQMLTTGAQTNLWARG